MVDHNPEQWTNEQWGAFAKLMQRDGPYKSQVQELRDKRTQWALEQTGADVGRRKVASNVRLKMLRDYQRQSRLKFPNPCPLALHATEPEAAGEGE